jgi:hypothetical protein
MPAGAEKSWAAALKNKQLLAAVCLQRLYFEIGHWQRDFLIDRMTARGRKHVPNSRGWRPLTARLRTFGANFSH